MLSLVNSSSKIKVDLGRRPRVRWSRVTKSQLPRISLMKLRRIVINYGTKLLHKILENLVIVFLGTVLPYRFSLITRTCIYCEQMCSCLDDLSSSPEEADRVFQIRRRCVAHLELSRSHFTCGM